MNRAQKRNMMKEGGNFQSPCTIAEAVQIARAAAEDVVADYHRQQSHLQVAISLQIEILKNIIISEGLITEEEFRAKYIEKAEEFNRLREEAENEMLNDKSTPNMGVKSNEIEVVSE